MASTVDSSGIDDTKPESGSATTSSVRDNFTEIKSQFDNAKTDIEAIQDGTTVTVANITSGDISGVNIDNSPIGATTPSSGAFTTLNTTLKTDLGDPGTESSGININGTTYTSTLRVNDIGGSNAAQFVIHRHSTTWQPLLLGARSNSNDSSHSAVTAGQALFSIYAAGWTGTHYDLFGESKFVVGTGTVSATSSPGKWILSLAPDGSNAPAAVITADSDKSVTFSGNTIHQSVSDLPPTTSGTATAYTVTLGISALETDRVYHVNFHTANTATDPTLNPDSIGAITLKDRNGDALTAGDLSGVCRVWYDGTYGRCLDIDNNGLLAESEVTGSAATTISFTDLDINTHKSYRIELEYITVSSGASVQIFFNGDSTATNYYSQYVYGNGSSVISARTNNSNIVATPANGLTIAVIDVMLINGYAAAFSRTTRDIGSSITTQTFSVAKTNTTVSNITQIDLSTDVASEFAVSTKERIYRRDR